MTESDHRPTDVRRSKHIPYELDPSTSLSGYYENHWKKVALELLLRHCPVESRTGLDYGCGRGETLQIFGQAGFRMTGTDVDPECVRLAGKYGPTLMLNPDASLVQFGPKSFDIVTCFHVLEHVDNPLKTLGALAQIARQFVVLAVPNTRYLHRITERRFDLSQINEGHLQSWDHWHLRNLAERFCGLELVQWGSDATRLPLISQLSDKLFGMKFTIWLETGLFRRIFPFHCISVLGLFRVKGTTAHAADQSHR